MRLLLLSWMLLILPIQTIAGTSTDLFGETLTADFFDVTPAQQKQLQQQLLLGVNVFKQLDEELNQLNAQGFVNNPSSNFLELLQLCEQWEKRSEVKFSCRLGGLKADWQFAAQKAELPDRTELRKKARIFLQQGWVVNAGKIVLTDAAKNSGFKISADGLLQGFALDKLTASITAYAIQQKINLHGLQLNLGVQQRCWGMDAAGRTCSVNQLNAAKIVAPNNGIAIVSQQDWQKIGPYKLSKILIPKEGWPVEFAPSVAVIASDAAGAAVIARSIAVQPIATGIRWVDSQIGAAALVTADNGSVFNSKAWYSLLVIDADQQPLWRSEKQFVIEYQTLEHNIAEYRRPYIAIWITTPDRQSVRQLLVHGDNARWLKEIQLWWRRYGRNNESAIDGLARATTMPGKHQLAWDGRDDKGNKVPKGNYLLHIEAAREHGEHELISLPFELSGQSFNVHATGEKELGLINITFDQQP